MKNLAGVEDCDKYIKEELSIAGIPQINLIGKMTSEVPASIIGYLNDFTFQRAWYYWIVKGYMPLQYAKELYENYKDLNIRVSGNCTNPPPEEWCEPKDFMKKCEPICEKYFNKKATYGQVNEECNKIKKQGDQFITHYHIDTQEGLLRFAEMIKKYNIMG